MNALVSGFVGPSRQQEIDNLAARAFFEAHFQPYALRHDGPQGLLTGYFEPVFSASRKRDDTFTVPLYARPPDLVNLVEERDRGAKSSGFTHMRRVGDGLQPYATRAEIEAGALAGTGLELAYLACPVDAFILHVQGSGLLQLTEGSRMRVTYDGKNGHPYTSVGRYLIDAGEVRAEDMTLEGMSHWLRTDKERGRAAMQQNASFVFFRELVGDEADAARGVDSIPLIAGRSLAVDTAYHRLATPVYVISETLRHAANPPSPFARLMIASDVGSAIKGPERGDIYFGSGAQAGALAGVTKHAAGFIVLLPRNAGASIGSTASAQ
jgi:membrane-bound lytic murein transglycosylase A